MESLIASYELNFSKFNDLLKEHKAIISGSSVLSLYLDNMFVPNDIDIWIPLGNYKSYFLDYMKGGTKAVGKYYTPTAYYPEKYDEISKKFLKFFWSSGFDEKELSSKTTVNEKTLNLDKDEIDNTYQNTPIGLNYIYKVIEFSNESGKKIQLVFIKHTTPVEFIDRFFDLSVCKTWYNPLTNIIETKDKENTSKKLMYISYNCSYEKLHPKNKDRVEKYKSRGFTLIKNPKYTTEKKPVEKQAEVKPVKKQAEVKPVKKEIELKDEFLNLLVSINEKLKLSESSSFSKDEKIKLPVIPPIPEPSSIFDAPLPTTVEEYKETSKKMYSLLLKNEFEKTSVIKYHSYLCDPLMLSKMSMSWILISSASLKWYIDNESALVKESAEKYYPLLQSYIQGPTTINELINCVNCLRDLINKKEEVRKVLYYAESMKYINKIGTSIWNALTLEEKANIYRFVSPASDYGVSIGDFYKNYRL